MAETRLSLSQYKTGLLKGDPMILSKAITLVESHLPKDEELASKVIQKILPYTGNSFRIGISGIPGAGKSTFIEAFGNYLVKQHKKVAVLAIDPSSKLSGGSILGDKTRMNELAKSELAFIRPTPAHTTLGGVAGKTYDTILLCEAAGFDYILIETVGVGQSETEVFDLTDFFLLLMITGMGDELQSMKKGVMELAHAIVINKADGENKENAIKAAETIRQTFKNFHSSFPSEVLTCSSTTGEGIEKIALLLDNYRTTHQSTGAWKTKRAKSTIQNLFKELNHRLLRDFYESSSIQKKLKIIENEVAEGKITPHAAAVSLLKNYKPEK